MPPLEAMACGIPVICSDNSSLPEAVGEAAIMVDAGDNNALTSAIEKVLSNAKLAAEMVAKGQKQAAKFNWEASAEKLSKILQQVVND